MTSQLRMHIVAGGERSLATMCIEQLIINLVGEGGHPGRVWGRVRQEAGL